VFRPNTVGASLLAAIAVPPERVEEIARLVSKEPGVNHNYLRENRYNVWFVVTASTESDVEAALARIELAAGLHVLRLPLLEPFHIDLGFDLQDGSVPRDGGLVPPAPPTAAEQALVRETVRGLPLVAAPYQEIAKSLRISERQVLLKLEEMLRDGRIRRIGAVIRHRRLGYDANAMVVWDVPDEKAGALGAALARDTAVTLCYRRARALPDWPYNLYCMVHGRERSRVLHEIHRLTAACGAGRYPRMVLFSSRCFTQKAANYG
jgi:DNA-binding Lrp family transcriptional regulator